MPKSNIRGLGKHPNRRRSIKGVPPHPSKLGRDGFAKRNPKRKARIA